MDWCDGSSGSGRTQIIDRYGRQVPELCNRSSKRCSKSVRSEGRRWDQHLLDTAEPKPDTGIDEVTNPV